MWTRAVVADALATLVASFAGEAGVAATVFAKPPGTLNPPAIVVGRPRMVRYGTAALSIDEVELPVACIGALDGDDVVDTLAGVVRDAVRADPTVGGTVQVAYPYEQAQWRAVNVAGADLLAADVVLMINQ
jgi:hypothetical protein